ncbi:MAG: GMC family oxidoreductase [Candidatus Eisenbacteria bacterium]|nr:GMC family oxidoreductase [Candidatus Eisenbacteria bacterium]
MSESTVAIVGSGIAGTAIAHALTLRGHDVVVFEKGPDFPYPAEKQFRESVLYDHSDPAGAIADDLGHMTEGNDGEKKLLPERVMVVGGCATQWAGIALRMAPRDFRTRTLYRLDEDWPLSYEELEPWYGHAESLLGVSGTDDDNPFAPPRSRPFPLPPFELSWDDRVLAARLKSHGIHIHTTPQARTRLDYDGRPGCANIGTCYMCPIGARYMPNHHLRLAAATGRCTVRSDVSVRRIVMDASGRARALVIRAHGTSADREHAARVIVVAAGSFETPRLLLLSHDARHPDGLGNQGGHVGRHLVFHHLWSGHMHYREDLFAGRAGFWTGQSHQFCDPPTRARHGGIKVEFSTAFAPQHEKRAASMSSAAAALAAFEPARRCRRVTMHTESDTSPRKVVRLSEARDRFGDPCAHVEYRLSEYDRQTFRFGRELFERVAAASGASEREFCDIRDFDTYNHYMGTCRMGAGPADSVVDPHGRVHGCPNLYLAGLSIFVGGGGPLNPTLTAVALALRTAEKIAEELG